MTKIVTVTKIATLLPPFDVDMVDEPPFIPTYSPVVKTTPAEMTKVLGGRSVLTDLYTGVAAQMEIRMPDVMNDVLGTMADSKNGNICKVSNVEYGKLYILPMMCGDEFWDGLCSSWWQRQAGEAFAHMVSTGMFPFEFVQYKKSCTKHYRMK
jgi:hypothetical protein